MIVREYKKEQETMTRIPKRLICAILVSMITMLTMAQDIHFSQFNASPLTLNPAMTGVNEGNYRFTANFRSQWEGIAPYRTIAAGYDMSLMKQKGHKNTNYAGVGISLFSDKAGDANLRTTQVNISASYTVMLSANGSQSLSSGITAGYGLRSIDVDKLTFDSQFGSNGFDEGLGSGETLDQDRIGYADIGAGFLYSISPNKKSNYYVGLAITHLNQPSLSFLDSRDEKLYMKATLHGGGYMTLSNQFSLLPSFAIFNQGPHRQFNFGTYVKMKTSTVAKDQTAVYVGAWYRAQDAIIAAARFDISGFQIGISYDINLSKLTPATRSNGGAEISMIYVGFFDAKRKVKYCPRL